MRYSRLTRRSADIPSRRARPPQLDGSRVTGLPPVATAPQKPPHQHERYRGTPWKVLDIETGGSCLGHAPHRHYRLVERGMLSALRRKRDSEVAVGQQYRKSDALLIVWEVKSVFVGTEGMPYAVIVQIGVEPV